MTLSIKQPLSLEDRAFIQKLERLDLEPIAFKLMHPDGGFAWTRELANLAISRYKMFLFLSYKYPHYQLVPTREIDTVWHQHILDTSKYVKDCQELFGQFVDHYPYFGLRSAEEQKIREIYFNQTKSLFEKFFGVDVLEERAWQSLESPNSQKASTCKLPNP